MSSEHFTPHPTECRVPTMNDTNDNVYYIIKMMPIATLAREKNLN